MALHANFDFEIYICMDLYTFSFQTISWGYMGIKDCIFLVYRRHLKNQFGVARLDPNHGWRSGFGRRMGACSFPSFTGCVTAMTGSCLRWMPWNVKLLFVTIGWVWRSMKLISTHQQLKWKRWPRSSRGELAVWNARRTDCFLKRKNIYMHASDGWNK